MKTNFFYHHYRDNIYVQFKRFAQVDGPILNGVDNTSEYKTIELINMGSLDLQTFDAFWTEYFFGAYHTPIHC
jgi:hypothetical protein